jgi:diadenosine tetraphosphate (Ap4A) HIT family hydrolase
VVVAACRICELSAEGDSLPLRERLYLDERFRISHAWSSLPGWLVVVPRRHVEALDELSEEEAAALGALVRRASAALREAVGCAKTYVVLFAEQEGFAHVHVHVVPRMDWFGPDERGYHVFDRFLAVPQEEWVPEAERERLARELGAAIGRTR